MRRWAQAGVGLSISAIALWLTFRGKDLGEIWLATREADYRYLARYVPFMIAIHLARTARWGILLAPLARVPFARLNAVSAVGFMALAILPFRLGELARPYLIAERPHLRVSAALSSVVVERIADGMFTGLLLVISLLAVPDGTPGVRVLRTGGLVVSLVFGVAFVFLALAYRNRARAVSFVAELLSAAPGRLSERVGGVLDAFISGLRVVPGGGKLALFFLLTFAYWGANAWGLQVLARGFGFSLDPVQACALLGVLVVGVMIPAGPGMVGTFQGAIVLGLGLFASGEAVGTRGVAFANVLWAAQIGFQVILGVTFLFSRHVQVARVFAAPGAVQEKLAAEAAEEAECPPGAR